MSRTLLGTGHFTWDAVERRSDRYGSIRLNDDKDNDILLDVALDALEGKQGRLIAEVLIPVKSPHMGDLHRGFKPSLPERGEIVLLGEGSLFIEHRGRAIHEKAEHERQDDKMMQFIEQEFVKTFGNNIRISYSGRANEQNEPEPEIYDVVGLKPNDGREKDWLEPRAFYRLHLSKINLYFEEL